MKKERHMTTMSDHHKAFHLSVMLCCADVIKNHETGDTHRSNSLLKKLRRLEGDIVKITDLYLPPQGFDYEDMKKAHIIVDLVNEKIDELYPANETKKEDTGEIPS